MRTTSRSKNHARSLAGPTFPFATFQSANSTELFARFHAHASNLSLISAFARQYRAIVCTTACYGRHLRFRSRLVGWLFRDDSTFKVLVTHVANIPEQVKQGTGDMTIPANAIIRIVDLDEESKPEEAKVEPEVSLQHVDH